MINAIHKYPSAEEPPFSGKNYGFPSIDISSMFVTTKKDNNTYQNELPAVPTADTSVQDNGFSKLLDYIRKSKAKEEIATPKEILAPNPEIVVKEEVKEKVPDKPITINGKLPPAQWVKSFNDAFDVVQIRHPEIAKYRPFLTALAGRESTFDPHAGADNKEGRALGYLQLMPMNRRGVSAQEFVNNPVLQLEMTWKLLQSNIKSISSTDRKVASSKGFTESALLAGAWIGGVGGMRNSLYHNINKPDNLGTTVSNYMNRFNKIL